MSCNTFKTTLNKQNEVKKKNTCSELQPLMSHSAWWHWRRSEVSKSVTGSVRVNRNILWCHRRRHCPDVWRWRFSTVQVLVAWKWSRCNCTRFSMLTTSSRSQNQSSCFSFVFKTELSRHFLPFPAGLFRRCNNRSVFTRKCGTIWCFSRDTATVMTHYASCSGRT